MSDGRVPTVEWARRARPAPILVRAERLSKTYMDGPEPVPVLRDLELSVAEGEMVAIVGASGSGKSTLLHLLGGLDRPTSGRVLVDGFDIFSGGEVDLARFRQRMIGFVFQFHGLLPEFTALENVMMPLLIGGMGRTEAARRAAAMLERVGLGHRLAHKPAQLSGGEQQRVALARALVHEPRVLLADEPTGNLDARTGAVVFALLEDLHRARGLTSIIATHNEALARRCDRVLHLQEGTVHEEF
jgi:lipoprotein-releasing system ATP-binding protein